MSSNRDTTVSAAQVLFAVAFLSLVLFSTLAFQTSQVLRDRDTLAQAKTQQDKPLEESRKVQAQVTALALGTKKLADGGDKDAATIIKRMEQAGVTVGGNPPAAAGTPAQPQAAPAAPTAAQP